MEVPKLTGQCLNRRVVWRKCSTSVANCWFDCIVTFYQGKISDVVFLYSAGIFTSDIAYWKILFVCFMLRHKYGQSLTRSLVSSQASGHSLLFLKWSTTLEYRHGQKR